MTTDLNQVWQSQVAALQARASRLLKSHRRRARRDGVELDYGLEQVRLLISKLQCYYCRAPLSFAMSLDHKQPIARGGKHAYVNLAVCCERCNRLKGQLSEAEFSELLRLLALLPAVARQDLERRLLVGGALYARKRS